MNCRVLHILNPRSKAPPPIMPVDMAMRVCLAGSPPLRSFLDDYDDFCSPSAATLLRPCISSEVSTATETEVETSGSEKKKKSVEFADSRGLALAVVHVFDEAEDDLTAELQFQLAEIEGVTAALNLEDVKDCASDLVLDFTPPAVDYLELRRRLRAQQVCLESCSVHDCRLSGTVQWSCPRPAAGWSSASSTRPRTRPCGTTISGTTTAWCWTKQRQGRKSTSIPTEAPERPRGSSLSGRAGDASMPTPPTGETTAGC
ncbi:protein phosphatase 1 regulatory subunit 3C-B-like isoform X2 [Solea solea]|uniref:protein phosphatase 1 regulatory subunit 3C-B-like isoform X2 n=1 Tax=Solea solea TaxID=90069 RepID=UPI00272A27AF|nr:protein phosphatase 1 regulatory subunit 3C-B-like isoform X2 [Solea solea]